MSVSSPSRGVLCGCRSANVFTRRGGKDSRAAGGGGLAPRGRRCEPPAAKCWAGRRTTPFRLRRAVSDVPVSLRQAHAL
eukprot:1195557-Prorocentrum_minimum.AAC.4